MEQEETRPAREVVYLKGELNPNSFEAKALALPGVKAVFGDDIEIEDPATGDTFSICELIERRDPAEIRVIEQGDRILVGVMTWDDRDMADPIAKGRVLCTEASDDKGHACKAVGLDRYQDMDFDFLALEDLKMKEVESYLQELRQDKERRLAIGKAMRSMLGVNDIGTLYRHIKENANNLDLDGLSLNVFGEQWFSRLPDAVRDALWDLGGIDSDEGNRRRWKRALSVGRIGDPFACLVDVRGQYSDCYRASGDTLDEAHNKSNFTVWVPDEGANEAIKTGILQELKLPADSVIAADGRGQFPWSAQCYAFNAGGVTSQPFPTWLECVEALLLSMQRHEDASQLESTVRKVACKEADAELSEYSDWASGEVFAVETFVINRNDPQDVRDADLFGGYIGRAYPEQVLESEVLGLAEPVKTRQAA